MEVAWQSAHPHSEFEYRGIEITKEDLINKCGFEGSTDWPYLNIESDYNAEIELNETGLFLRDCDGGRIGVEIKYIHQLQNRYFTLTEEELTIKYETKVFL